MNEEKSRCRCAPDDPFIRAHINLSWRHACTPADGHDELDSKNIAGSWQSHNMTVSTAVLSQRQRVPERRQVPMTETGPRALRRRVLIVEDEAPIRELMRLHLGLAGLDEGDYGTGTRGTEQGRH